MKPAPVPLLGEAQQLELPDSAQQVIGRFSGKLGSGDTETKRLDF